MGVSLGSPSVFSTEPSSPAPWQGSWSLCSDFLQGVRPFPFDTASPAVLRHPPWCAQGTSAPTCRKQALGPSSLVLTAPLWGSSFVLRSSAAMSATRHRTDIQILALGYRENLSGHTHCQWQRREMAFWDCDLDIFCLVNLWQWSLEKKKGNSYKISGKGSKNETGCGVHSCNPSAMAG